MSQLLEVQGVSFSYTFRRRSGGGSAAPPGRPEGVLKDVSFSLGPGEFVSLVGPNGTGKTTLLNLISGYRSCESGTIRLEGRQIEAYSPMERARKLAVISQNENLNFPFTCMELVLLGLYPRKSRFQSMTDEQLEEIRQVMRMTDTLELANKLIGRISGGELQRVVLARALLQKPKLLLLDEAMSDLDIAAKISMVKCLKEMVKKENISILAINHDLANAYQFSDRILLLKDGRLIGDGRPAAVVTEQSVKEVFAVKARIQPGVGFYVYDNLES